MQKEFQNSWAEYRISVLQQLTWLTDSISKNGDKLVDLDKAMIQKIIDLDTRIMKKFTKIETRLTTLEVKSGIYGGIAGFVISLLINWFINSR